MADFSDAQRSTLHNVIIAASSLSVLGCLYVLVHHFRLRHRASPTSTQTMVAILSLLELAVSVPKMIGVAGANGSFECNMQGFLLSFVGVMSVIWNACLAHSIYRKIVCRESEEKLQRRLRLYILVTIVPALSGSCLQWALGLIGEAIFYCWLSDWRLHIACLYTWVLASIIYIAVVLFVTQHHINQRARIQGNLEAFESSASIALQLRLYIILFAVSWMPGVLFRVFGKLLGLQTFAMAIVMQAALCSLGFSTSIVYGGLLSRPLRICRSRRPSSVEYHAMTAPTNINAPRSLMNGDRLPLDIFVTTFNMGEGHISNKELERWIPRGHDMYVIGVQECLQLNELRQQIRRHIEGHTSLRANSSHMRFKAYEQYCREIGSSNTSLGYHGYIAITIYVRARDVKSGAFFMAPRAQQAVNCGKSLLFGQRASNKGAVGFGFRYFDTSFAFVTCHLTSDLKGKSHVDRRSRDASDVIKSLHLNVDDVGFEFPLLHHHTFVLGDLNYRLRQLKATPNQILELVCNARITRSAESNLSLSSSMTNFKTVATRNKLLGRTSSWLPTSLSGRTSSHSTTSVDIDTCTVSTSDALTLDTLKFDAAETPKGDDKAENSRIQDNAWDDVLAHDELLHMMNESQVFYGFEEPKIAFDPTFRRVRERGIPSRGRQMTAEELSIYFTTAIEGRGERVPSYTDRILHFSQPDMRMRLECSSYKSSEFVTCSDHKPVSAVFRTAVDRDFRPLVSMDELESRPRLQDVSGVLECALRIECVSLTWNHNAHPTLDAINPHHLRVTVVFPLPSEDAFSEQRTLHEFAAHLRGGVFASESVSDAEPMANMASVSYQEFRQLGIRHMTLARLVGSMHVALKIHTDVAAPTSHCLGQGVIGLPRSVLEGTGDGMPFLMSLSRGGQLRGTLEGYVTLITTQAT